MRLVAYKTMPEVTLIMAPHLNSYRRLVSETHAPNIISWGYENRTVALRVPGGIINRNELSIELQDQT